MAAANEQGSVHDLDRPTDAAGPTTSTTSTTIEADPEPTPLSGDPWYRRLSPSGLLLLAVLTGLFAVLAVRLGPALLGFKVFGGVDLLTTRAPWLTGATLPTSSMIPDVTDNLDSIFPSYIQMHVRLFNGDLPWWSSLAGPGAELMALPSTPTLTPSSIWMLLFPTSWSLGFTKLVEVLLAFGGMTFWLRRLGTSWAAGALAGLLYVGSGFMTAWANWLGQASVACMIPFLFWAIERFLQIRTARSALPISAVVAFLLLGGFPAVSGHALYAGAAYFVVRLVTHHRTSEGSGGLRTAIFTGVLGIAAVLLGVGLSAIQLLPQVKSLQGFDLGYRAAQFDAEQPIQSFLSVFYPRAFNSTEYPGSNPIEAYAYVGFGALALAAIAVLAGRWSRVGRGTVLMLVVTFVLAAAVVWDHGFWTDWLRDVPIFNGNNSGRLRDLVAFAGCALAGIGANVLFTGGLPAAVRRRLIVGAWVLAIGGGLASIAVAYRYRQFIGHWLFIQDAGWGVGTIALVAVVLMLRRPVADQSPTTTAEPLVLHSRRTEPGSRRAALLSSALVGIVALTAIQAGNSVSFYWPLSSPENFYPATPAIQAVQASAGSNRVMPLQSFFGSSAAAYGIRTITGHTFQPESWKDVVNSIDPNAYTALGQSPTNPAISLQLTDPRLSTDGKLMDRMAVKTIVAGPGLRLPGPLLLTNGTPARTAALGVERVPVTTGSSSEIPLAPKNLRGIQVSLAAAIPAAGRSISLTATISNAAGTVLATGLMTRPRYGVGPLQIPVPGEKLGAAAGPLTLKISVTQPGGPPRTVMFDGLAGSVGALVIGSQNDGLTEVFADNTASVWSRSTAMPRVRWATGALVLPTPSKLLAAMADPATSDSTVLLSKDGAQPSGQAATLDVLTDTGDDVDVDVQAAGAGYLVLADSIQTGWKVTVDGAPAVIQNADHAFGAVFVPAGHSQVSFFYVGRSLKTGFAITLASLLVVAVVLVLPVVIRRRRTLRRADPGGRPRSAHRLTSS